MASASSDTAKAPLVASTPTLPTTQADTAQTAEEKGNAQASFLIAALTQWTNAAQSLHDNRQSTTERATAASWALTALDEAFYSMPVTPAAVHYGSPLRRDGGALAMAATLWPSLVSFTGEELDTDADRERLVSVIEDAFHIARVALVAGMATMATLDRRPAVDGALKLMQAAAGVASRIIEPETADK